MPSSAKEGAVRQPVTISMFSGPRNISTTMMRSFENRPDTAALDEPFYGAYLARTGAPHPLRDETLAVYPSTEEAVLDWINDASLVASDYLFCKHIAYHFREDDPLDWSDTHMTFLLIRDPRAMIASFARKYDDLEPVVDSYRTARRLLARRDGLGLPCPVIDSSDVLADPAMVLSALCAELGMGFDRKMLEWPAGARAGDGPWGAHWYDAVNASTGFGPPTGPALALEGELARAAEACEADYRELFERRLRPA